MEAKRKVKGKKLIPADPTRCQALIPNGHSFMSLGGVPGRFRCDKKPTHFLFETVANPKDGKKGSMSVCPNCLAIFIEQKHGNLKGIKIESL